MNVPTFPSPDPAVADEAGAARADLAAKLRALAHPARLAMLDTLAGQERCVCGEIVRALPLAQSTVSQHLKVLLDAGLIRSRTEGQRSSYCLDRAALDALAEEIDALFKALRRPSGCCTPGASDQS
ncbi:MULTISPECIES: ArsR/SmtB family transcription factor [Xanthobacter]|uniref:ArsR/SmtB family transcription factor n=1 Tax=Xanthobacter TaxID=279 RepID=UPI001AE35F0E|nr:metalloregulator ArsR/SmtB family transcription factor [Xanthobacter flavus]MBP2151805.1 ArsR family transcriptional regulator [Xanthobacter flavus]